MSTKKTGIAIGPIRPLSNTLPSPEHPLPAKLASFPAAESPKTSVFSRGLNVIQSALSRLIGSEPSKIDGSDRGMVDGGAPKDFPTKLFKQLEPASLGMVDGGVRKDFPTEIFQNTNRSENEVFDLPVPKARTLDELKQYTGLSMMQLGPLPILDMGMVDRPATSVTAEVAKVESDQLKVRVKPAERPRDSEGPSL